LSYIVSINKKTKKGQKRQKEDEKPTGNEVKKTQKKMTPEGEPLEINFRILLNMTGFQDLQDYIKIKKRQE